MAHLNEAQWHRGVITTEYAIIRLKHTNIYLKYCLNKRISYRRGIARQRHIICSWTYNMHHLQIFAFEKHHDLETRVSGHSKSIGNDRSHPVNI